MSAANSSEQGKFQRGRQEERIVVVNADPPVLELFRETLERKGQLVTYLTEAQQAIDHVQHGGVDVLFMDLRLPDSSWQDLLKIVKDRLPDTPVVVTADPVRMREAIAALSDGAFDYLLKPFRPEELEGVLIRALREKELNAEQRRGNRVTDSPDQLHLLNRRLDQTVKELSLLFRVSQLLAITEDLSSMTAYLVETLADALRAERVSLLLMTVDRNALEVAASHGLPEDGRLARVPLGEGVAGRVLQEAIPLRIQDIAQELHRPSRHGYRTGAFLAVPLYAGVQPIGVLALSDPIGRHSFSEEEMGCVLSIARMAATAISHRQLSHSHALQVGRIERLEGFVRNLLENLPGGVMTIDHVGVITYLNPRGEKILGISAESAAGRPYQEVLQPSLYPSPFLASLASMDPVDHEDVSVTGPAGVPMTLTLSTSYLIDERGERQGTVIAFSALRRLGDVPERALRSQTLATLGELAAGLAHEVRNPLAGMLTGAQLIAQRLPNDDPCREYANLILEEGQRLEDLIRSLLDFARPSKANLTECSVNEIVDRALALVKPLIHTQKIQVRRQYASAIGEILADRQGLLQVFLNLILNAVQAMPRGGNLHIQTSRGTDGVNIEIKDSGEGIPSDLVKRIFDPFFTTKPEGTGLGLALSLKIIHDHGGKMTVHSQPGEGTSFVVHLPVAPPQNSVFQENRGSS
jgi:PAS domain S-box-containing protein